MKLPWENDELKQEIKELEEEIEQIRAQKESTESKLEAEKERRKDLSREKQEAEEELNRLKDKLKEIEATKTEEKEERQENKEELEKLDFSELKQLLQKLATIRSEEDLVTVYSPGNLREFDKMQEIKNAISSQQFQLLQGRESFVAFLDQGLGNFVIKTVPFFSQKLEIRDSFEANQLIEFMESEKYWTIVSAGETTIYSEQDGNYEELERVNSRVDKEHSKGGFSQGRFERKRDEQIDQHLEKVEEALEEFDGQVYLLGDKRLCEELPGEHLGGFDPNRKKPEQFYRFQILKD